MMLSSHVLDLSKGAPAVNVEIVLYECDGRTRKELARGSTDADGRIGTAFAGELTAGEYELEFGVGAYFAASAVECFFDRIPIRFRVSEARRYHVPLLLSPWGYSTYRGS